ncbi:MAG TPA: ABC transporter permease, partial [Terriglobales bacterium]|nr:ABC transporter permease [Terriglobales bacterium]
MNWAKRLFTRRELHSELSEEIRAHIEEKVEELVAEGMPREEAEHAARREFGNVSLTEEDGREVWRWNWIEDALQDVRFGLRQLRKSPGFTATAILTLALGIGANTAIFSVVNAVLLRPLPFKQASRLVALHEGIPKLGYPKMGFSPPDLEVFEREQKSFSAIGAYQNNPIELSGQAEPDRVTAARISASLFPMLGVEPMLGRNFTPQEDERGHNVAILSYELWQRRYGGDPEIVGKAIEINRTPYTVIGVMGQRFEFPLRGPEDNGTPADLWVPMAFTPAEMQDWGGGYFTSVVGRLRPDVTLDQASGEAETLAHAIVASYPPAITGSFRGALELEVHGEPFQEEIVAGVRTLVLVLMASVAFVLLIACANIATLLVSRAATRQREISVRTALGASRMRLVRQLLTESLLLATAGGGLGILLAGWGRNLLLALVPASIPLPRGVALDGNVLGYAACVSILAAILFGLLPALQASGVTVQDSLRESGRGASAGRSRHRVQGILVTVEFALALVLLIGAGLLVRSLTKIVETNPGIRAEGVLTL